MRCEEIVRFLNLPETKEKFFAIGVTIVANLPQQLAATIKSDMATMGKIIKDVGIRAD
jgi:tripartite-type tricarboxylate transporter receptor subunit TctC